MEEHDQSTIPPVDEELQDLTDFFKTFGDATRLRILFALSQGEQNVQSLTESLGVQQAALSHQLATLRLLRIVTYRKEGRRVFYSLDDEHIASILHIGMDHIQEAQRR